MTKDSYATLADTDLDLESEHDVRNLFKNGGETGIDGEWKESDNELLSAIVASSKSFQDKGKSDSTGDSESSSSDSDELFGLDEDSTNAAKLIILSKQSAPVIASFFLGLVGNFINLLFAGRFIPTDGDRSVVFAGISLANMFVNVTCLSLLLGMSSAVETLGSQHNGAGNYVKVGLVLQRSFAVLTAMSIPLLCLWFFVYEIYMYIGVERDVCEVIKSYVYIRALAVPIDIINESYEKYLMSIGVMEPSMWSNVAFNIFVVVFNSTFVFGFGWEYRSLAISWVLSTYLMAFVQIGLSLRYPSVLRTLQPWDWRAFEEWPQFILLGLPGTVMLCSEWWAFEFLMLLATFLGTAQVAAQAIILQISSIAFMVPLGIGVTCASFVGNAIGAGKLKLAQQIGKLSLAYAAVINTILGGIILLGADQFVALFTTDPHVIEETDRAIPFLAMFIMIDGLQGVASGVLRGTGKQFLGAVANVCAYYGVGLPMAYLVCFKLHFGVDGLMMGIASGSLVQVIVLLTLIFVFQDYLYSSHLVRREEAFLPLSMDESAHNSSTGEVEMGPRAPGKAGGMDKSVYSNLHGRHSDVSIDVTVDDSDSDQDGHGGNDYSV